MVENRPIARLLAHFILIIGVIVVAFPVYYTFVASTQATQPISVGQISLWPGDQLLNNYGQALSSGVAKTSGTPVGGMLLNSFIVALLIAVGKIAISLLSAYAVVFFSFPLRMVFFWMIFITLMLPVEVRILPTYKVVAQLGMLDSFAGLTIPLIASATATLLFRQFFLTIPDELVEAAKIDGAGPLRFLRDMVIPLSRTNIAALFVILFIYGWNQYLWPLLITNSGGMETVIVGIKRMMGGADADTDWGAVMATTMLAMLPPVAVVMLMQRWFVKGLVDAEK
jgi:sn-glycerol 3-phosphate transport system permease protein